MREVLFICQGNVGRSQMAEGFYNHYKGQDLAISAGIDDVGSKYNYIPRADIIKVMQEKDVDISSHRIKKVIQSMLDEVNLVVILCNSSLLPDFILTSALNIQFQEVLDPFESSIDGVRGVRDQIEKIVLQIISSHQ